MNSNTKEAMKRFIEQVEQLAQCAVLMSIDADSIAHLMDSAEALKDALDKDETIL